MGLQEVKEDIIEEAEQKADKIKEEAENKAKEIKEDARKKANTIEENAKNEVEEEKEKMEQKMISNAKMDARKRKLEAKQSAIKRVFRDFRKEIEELSDEDIQDFVERCIEIPNFEVGKIKASEKFRPAIDDRFDVESLENEGIIVMSKDGERRQSFTLERIHQTIKQEKRQDIAEVLFD